MRYKRHLDAVSIEELERKFSDLVGMLSAVQLPYHFGDETMMAQMASDKKRRRFCSSYCGWLCI